MAADTPQALSSEQIEHRLSDQLPGWRYQDGSIRRHYATAGWKGALMVCGAVGHLAEVAWHHPDLEVSWGGVTVKLATHSAGGITDLDFALARRIDDFLSWQPGEDGLPGTPDDPRYTYLKSD